jgi:hypothetical protein
MMRCSLHSDDAVHYESVVRSDSAQYPGVSYAIRRMSFGRRSELLRQIREVGRKAEYLEAGHDLKDKIEASLTGSAIDALYLRWGLQEVSGLSIDGEGATIDSLWEGGPESLVREILVSIKRECGLSAEETKN